ncbi:MAG: hypothetical protein AMQ22_00563 [Candidatus Methanofastidiosum methylothiophilum]|uniref:Uncharacterized protein n=1 Tax=Candidatus Methanofastidiosum methylothiophilum TaxID=1705564 RepID=A0A150J6Z7_9EURY|nr:MAG: hypothetical protein AMQ22_00563 [Candidatus Methanofastidiosum methylthiophilus]
MKKIFAIIIGFLFFGSIFGIASITAGGGCDCSQVNFLLSQTTVQVGDTFTITKRGYCLYDEQPYPGTLKEMLQFVSGSDEGIWETVTFRALRPGTITYTSEDCSDVHIVTIVPKEYPIFSFMNILGFGKRK